MVMILFYVTCATIIVSMTLSIVDVLANWSNKRRNRERQKKAQERMERLAEKYLKEFNMHEISEE